MRFPTIGLISAQDYHFNLRIAFFYARPKIILTQAEALCSKIQRMEDLCPFAGSDLLLTQF